MNSALYEYRNKSARRGAQYADFLLENSSTKDNKYVVNQKLEHVDGISFRELFSRIRVVFVLQNKMFPFLAQGICLYVGYSFL